jgi:hypothetical protein
MTMNSSDVAAGQNATATQQNNLRKDLRNAIKDLQTAVDGATVTFNLALGAIWTVTLGGDRTFALSNVTSGQSFRLIIRQDGTGTRLGTWFAGILWANGGTAPILSTGANRYDIIDFFYDGTNYYGTVVGQDYA